MAHIAMTTAAITPSTIRAPSPELSAVGPGVVEEDGELGTGGMIGVGVGAIGGGVGA
jgi:hypothetical protein